MSLLGLYGVSGAYPAAEATSPAMHATAIAFLFALGACVGSFLNVVVWRLPRGESLVTPPSHCPVCNHRLAWYDNVPVFGWLMLRGRCRYCYNPISARYPTVEFITGAVFVFYYVMIFMAGHGPCAPGTTRAAHLTFAADWPLFVAYLLLVSALLAASLIDAELYIIPRGIPIVIAAVGIVYHTLLGDPMKPGNVNVSPAGPGGLMAAGGTLGLAVSLALVWRRKIRRSFEDGYPPMEHEEAPPEQEQKQGWLGRLVSKWVDAFRRELTPEQRTVMQRHLRAAEAREKELAEAAEAAAVAEEQKQGGAGDHSEAPGDGDEDPFSPSRIRREMRYEMLFLLFPLGGAIAAVLLAHWIPGAADAWRDLLTHNRWLTGLLGSLLGALVGGFVVWLTRILGSVGFGKEAMGLGDVDLMFGVGAVIGAGPVTVAFFLAPFFGALLAVYQLVAGKGRQVPFGPYLSMGTAAVLLFYCPIADYLAPGLSTLVAAAQQFLRQLFGFLG